MIQYVLRTNGVEDAVLTIREDDAAGTEIWRDTCINSDLAKPVILAKPVGVRQKQKLYIQVSGAGAAVDIVYE